MSRIGLRRTLRINGNIALNNPVRIHVLTIKIICRISTAISRITLFELIEPKLYCACAVSCGTNCLSRRYAPIKPIARANTATNIDIIIVYSIYIDTISIRLKPIARNTAVSCLSSTIVRLIVIHIISA